MKRAFKWSESAAVLQSKPTLGASQWRDFENLLRAGRVYVGEKIRA